MLEATLKREPTTDDGTLGELFISDLHFCFTLEETDKNNGPDSCIPAGDYICRRVNSPHFGETFEVTGVPGRSLILIHWGNTEKDTLGCILLGKSHGELLAVDDDKNKAENQLAVLNSRTAFKDFMELMTGINVFKLSVVWT